MTRSTPSSHAFPQPRNTKISSASPLKMRSSSWPRLLKKCEIATHNPDLCTLISSFLALQSTDQPFMTNPITPLLHPTLTHTHKHTHTHTHRHTHTHPPCTNTEPRRQPPTKKKKKKKKPLFSLRRKKKKKKK
ncbi:hypothetical protein PFLUV_G00167690, partial [Perca fluviatilis]